jgi:hypothetical protein
MKWIGQESKKYRIFIVQKQPLKQKNWDKEGSIPSRKVAKDAKDAKKE